MEGIKIALPATQHNAAHLCPQVSGGINFARTSSPSWLLPSQVFPLCIKYEHTRESASPKDHTLKIHEIWAKKSIPGPLNGIHNLLKKKKRKEKKIEILPRTI